MKTSELRELVREVLAEEEGNEPELIQIARRIVKNKQFEKVKDPVSGKRMALDMFSASAIVSVYDALNDTQKANLVKYPLPKIVDVVFKLIK